MLADNSHPTHAGAINTSVIRPSVWREELIKFIAGELPQWRDRCKPKEKLSETTLTSRLCAHLNSAARHAAGWDILQFRSEEPDETKNNRKIDLAAAPCGTVIQIDGRSYEDWETLLPIECKRFPIPKGKERDEREYVFSQYSTTGGIQRFKAGHHGASHRLGAMVGYIEEDTRVAWNTRVAEWIEALVKAKQDGWTMDDLLRVHNIDDTLRMILLHSAHQRANGLPEIELRHLWIEIN